MSEQSRRAFIAVGVRAALMAPSLIAWAHQPRAAQPSNFTDDDAIRDLLRQRIDVDRRSVGMAVCVVTPDRTRFVAWGRQRLNDDHPVTSDTVFEIGSITKVFTAFLLADMARRGGRGGERPHPRPQTAGFKDSAV
jgi:CubicO group peptidase (beta-lactamase class C family)